MSIIADRLQQINENIEKACRKAGRQTNSVSMVVVTKTATLEQIRQVVELGYTELGENRIQQLKPIATEIDEYLAAETPSMPKKVNWHMIGHLQRNKVKQVLPIVRLIHSVDTLRLAEEISDNSKKLDLTTQVLLQVNCSQEHQKHGVPVGAAIHLAEQMSSMPNIKLLGLMTMAPFTEDQSEIRTAFTRAREIFDEIKKERFAGKHFQHLSMGMSGDYQIAIEEGSTILRIGSAIFN